VSGLFKKPGLRQAVRAGIFFWGLLLVFFQSPGAAQDIIVSLSASPQELGINDRLQLTVSVSGKMMNVPEAQIQGLENFTVAGRSQSTQISMVNFEVTATKTTNYTLVPNQEGALTIGPAVVNAGGKSYSSGTVTVKVGAGAAAAPGPSQPPGGTQPAPAPQQAPQSGREVRLPSTSVAPDKSGFIMGSVDKREVYLGEQLTYTFGFYNRLRLAENPGYSPPSFNGFWVETLDDQARQSTRSVNGIIYSVQELRYALFPTIEGEAKISGAKLSYSVGGIRDFFGWDIFDRGKKLNLETPAVEIKVKPLPLEGRPANFSGAVGKFNISGKLDKNNVKQGEAFTLILTVSGEGNIKTIQEPVLAGMDNFDIYESKSEENIDRSSGVIKGRKVFKYVIVPRKAGEYNWPGIPFSYFDPQAEKYFSLKTGDISFSVLPGAQEQETVTYRLSPESVVAVGEDIRYIKEGTKALQGERKPLFQTRLFWFLHLVPLVSLAVSLLYRRHKGRLLSDTGYARLKGSRKRLARHLKEAAKAVSSGDWTAGYAAAERALVYFIGDKLNVETVGMVTEGMDELLTGRNIDEEVRKEVQECLEHFAYVRFAPQTGADEKTARQYLKKVRRLADHLDRAL